MSDSPNPSAASTPSLPLDPAEATRLTEFARACKAAARAVVLYPAGHSAIGTTLGRIVQLTSPASLPAPMKITVLANGLQIGGRAPARPDASLAELATLLHDHLIGELTVKSGGDADAWRNFLLLLGRPSAEVRAEGGISRLWATTAGDHVELREIDYAEVLREKHGGDPAAWEHIIANCLLGDTTLDLDEEEAKILLEIASDAAKLGDLFADLEARAAEDQTPGARARAVLRLLREIMKAAKRTNPEGIDGVLRNMASAIGRVSPEMMVQLLSQSEDAMPDAAGIVDAVVTRMTEKTVAGFIARNADAGPASIDRVAQAFHTLVRDDEQKQRLISMAHDDAAKSPFGSTEGFEDAWNALAEKLLTSYSDKPYVSDSYARELSGSRTQAITIDQIKDDPPERMKGWLGSVATSELRRLDLTLLLDLLKLERDDERWGTLMTPVVALLEDLLLVGDFEAVASLTAELTTVTGPDSSPARRDKAKRAIDSLTSGSLVRHMTTHLGGIDDASFERIKALCLSLGEGLVTPITESLATDINERARDRLTAVLVAFGPAARRQVERLKSSDSPAVRRTALNLLRELGGQEALPELTELLNDRSAQIQREAVRAILNIGSDSAFEVLQRALISGTEQTRGTIMKSLSAARDERSAPMLSYIISHVDHKGPHQSLYVSAIEAPGALKDPQAVSALKDALYRGEWWAPRRTAALRSAAATALARIGSPDAIDVLEHGLSSGSRGVKTAVRPHMAKARARRDTEVKT
jgi:hypothetical protein